MTNPSYDVDVTGIVRAPIDKVWALFRPFGKENMEWWPIFASMELAAPGKDEVGAVRVFKTTTGRDYKESLVERDDANHKEVYRLDSIEPAVPTLKGIDTTVQMTAEGNNTKIRWSSQIDVGSVFKGRIESVQEGVYTNAIKSLDRHFNPALGKLSVQVNSARNLSKKSKLFAPDPYVIMSLDGGKSQHTKADLRKNSPQWNETLVFDVLDKKGKLLVQIWDANLGEDELLGSAVIDIHELVSGTAKTFQNLDLENSTGQITLTLTLNLNDGEHLGVTDEVALAKQGMQLMGLIDKIKQKAMETAMELARGPQKTFGYARYGRSPQIPDVPLENLPRMVAGLPANAALQPEKLGRMAQRGLEYGYSEVQFLNRLQEDPKDPFNAFFGDWVKRPYAADHWMEDTEMCRQLIQGVNPLMIKVVNNMLEVPEGMRELKAQDTSMTDLCKAGRLFLLDYEALGDLKPYQPEGAKKMYFYAPYMLVYREELDGGDSRLNIVAIQLTRKGNDPIYTPNSDQPNRYAFAKMHVACADNQYHQWLSHLGYAHLAMEPFAIAHHNAFPEDHAIGKMLKPHFHDTIGINFLARQTLVSDIAPFTDRTFSTGTAQALKMFLKAWESYDFFEQSFPEQLKKRGFDEKGSDGVKDYFFREDGFLIWNALKEYTTGAVNALYKDDAAVAADTVIQGWCAEITDPERGDVKSFPAKIESRELLANTLTTLIWAVSAQHSAVNFPQFDYLSYVPNRPDSLFQEMPEAGDDITAEFIQSALPSMGISHFQISFAYLLTLPSEYPLTAVDGLADLCPQVHQAFMGRLKEISQQINERNAALVAQKKAPYEYLLPEKIAASIAI